jgi:hypothetical protein
MSPFGPLDTLDPVDGSHRCPVCGNPTVYQAFSGGKEWYCKTCDETGLYPPTMPNPPRANPAPDPGGSGRAAFPRA